MSKVCASRETLKPTWKHIGRTDSRNRMTTGSRKNQSRDFILSPREARVGRELERGGAKKKSVLHPGGWRRSCLNL